MLFVIRPQKYDIQFCTTQIYILSRTYHIRAYANGGNVGGSQAENVAPLGHSPAQYKSLVYSLYLRRRKNNNIEDISEIVFKVEMASHTVVFSILACNVHKILEWCL